MISQQSATVLPACVPFMLALVNASDQTMSVRYRSGSALGDAVVHIGKNWFVIMSVPPSPSPRYHLPRFLVLAPRVLDDNRDLLLAEPLYTSLAALRMSRNVSHLSSSSLI